jgi:hypothetical protein
MAEWRFLLCFERNSGTRGVALTVSRSADASGQLSVVSDQWLANGLPTTEWTGERASALKGRGFSRATSRPSNSRALAPEGMLLSGKIRVRVPHLRRSFIAPKVGYPYLQSFIVLPFASIHLDSVSAGRGKAGCPDLASGAWNFCHLPRATLPHPAVVPFPVE